MCLADGMLPVNPILPTSGCVVRASPICAELLGEHTDRAGQRQRAAFRGLEDHAISGQESCDDLREGKDVGRVPRHDRHHHAIRAAEHKRVPVRPNIRTLGVEPRRIVERHLLPFGDAEKLAACLRQGLAVLTDKDSGTPINIGFEARQRFLEDGSALGEGEAGPCRLSGLCGSDRLVDVGGRPAHNCPHELVRPSRIPDLDPLSAIDRLPVDQHEFGNRGFGIATCLHCDTPDMLTFGGLQLGQAYYRI
jgi:hypothetical protein